jgi:hypothetical protein
VSRDPENSRERRVVKNEVAFRAYNERRDRFERDVTDGPLPFVCECGDDGCFRALQATAAEWEDVHRRDDLFLVLPDHVFPEFERVVERNERFWIVQKFVNPAETLL